MATQITATLPTLDFPLEADYPTQEDWAAFSAAAEENFGILGGSWSTQMQLWKTEANTMSAELNNNADIAQSIANYQGDWTSKGYTLGQSVSVSGVYYICKLTHATGQNPTAVGSLYWNLALGNWNLKVNTDMSGYTSKTTPVDADLIPLSDSAASFGIKKLSWTNLKATLKTYFDTLYLNLFAINKGVVDINTLSSGRNYVAPSSANNPVAVAGFIDCITLEGSNILQIFTTVSSTESATAIQYIRIGNYVTNTWTGWTKQYSQRNIIGTVSQSAGVPTGAIIEQGSNVNGEWTKYADGTIEGSCTLTSDLTTSTTSGSVFIATTNITIPTTLASINDVQLTGQRVSGGIFWAALSGAYSTTNIPCYGIASTTGSVGKIKAKFRGRWY